MITEGQNEQIGDIRVVIIDSNHADLSLAETLLRQAFPDAEIMSCGVALEFARVLAGGNIDIAITEQQLDWGSGIEVLEALKQQSPDCQNILFSRQRPAQLSSSAHNACVDEFLLKDSDGFLHLADRVRNLLRPVARDSSAETFWSQLQAQLSTPALTVFADGRILSANGPAARALGAENPESMTGRFVQELFSGAREDAAEVSLVHQLHTLARGATSQFAIKVAPMSDDLGLGQCRLDASRIPGSDRIALMYNGGEQGSSGRGAGVSEQDYQQLLYAVSHDFQEPLQLLGRFAHLLKDACNHTLDSDCQRFVANLNTNAARMQSMLDDLLEFSRMGRMSATVEEVDLDQILDQIGEMYEPRLAAVEGQIRKAGLPTVIADRGQMNRLFQNLIGNAIKFHGEEPLVITVSARVEDHGWELVVRDNGIGIESERLGQVFEMFKRAHQQQDFPGNGMGLSLCQKIVEFHGGKIWAHSEPGKGTAIHFTLSREGPANQTVTEQRTAS
ncbi:MAG: ATP-binding protein [bacterium]